ncbi:hypothetical protein [Rummeliibacillus pycnus]|uniref:hypothetical protein n=1 Tax=Rummeliibacillus pycnus TaxID=101070 RepID=UPI0037CC9E28
MNDIIQSITHKHTDVSFVDLQSVFTDHLSKVNSSDYINTKVLRVMKDVLFYKKSSRIDSLSKNRGLHLTLDGIHLNSAGAQIVADMYASEINRVNYKNQNVIH